MGNDQSKSADAEIGKPLDYYELLQVSEDASGDEIKKAYRRLAVGGLLGFTDHSLRTIQTRIRIGSKRRPNCFRTCNKRTR